MPMREIRQKYTLSDISLLSWHSKQQSYNMQQKYKSNSRPSNGKEGSSGGQHLKGYAAQITETETHYLMPADLNNGVAIPKKFFNAKGDLDLRLATGPEACNYLRALGLDMPPVLKF